MKCKYYSKISLEKDNLQNTCNISITNIYQKPFSLVNLDKISYLWLGGSSDAAFQCDSISSIDTQVLEESLELGRGVLHLLTTDLDLHLPGFHHTFHSHDFLLFHGL